MAIPQAIKKIGKVLGGLFLGLSGGWLLAVCIGGILTLGALSVFHLGVLLSVGAIGLCLLVVGVCVLYDACVNPTVSAPSSVKTDDAPDDTEILLGTHNTENSATKSTAEPTTYYGTTPLYNPYTATRGYGTNRPTTSQPSSSSGNQTSYNPFG